MRDFIVVSDVIWAVFYHKLIFVASARGDLWSKVKSREIWFFFWRLWSGSLRVGFKLTLRNGYCNLLCKDCIQEISVKSNVMKFLFLFSSKSLLVLSFTFMSVIYFELIFYMAKVRVNFVFFFPWGYPISSSPLVGETILSSLNCLGTFVKHHLMIYVYDRCVFLGSLF